MQFEKGLDSMSRRTFIKGMGAVAASMALPSLLVGEAAEARVATGGGLRVTRFAHLTDLHFTTRKQNRYPTSHAHIRRAVQDLNSQDLDFVLFTGDMFHFAEEIDEEMPALQDALKGMKHPYYIALGNHDTEGKQLAKRKKFLCNQFGDRGLACGDNFYEFSPAPGLRFIVLDSTDVDDDEYFVWTGHLSKRQTDWLKATLHKYRDETIAIALHHPPVTPYPFMDKLKFGGEDRQRLLDIISKYPNVQLMFAGHFHFGGRNQFGPAQLILGPSLVEHPHPYRVIEVQQMAKAKGQIAYEWKHLNMHAEEDHACANGSAAVRSMGLLSLSYLRNGVIPVALPN